MQKSQFEEALAEFQKRLDPAGKSDPALDLIAIVYAKTGKMEEARKILNDLTEVSSSKTQLVCGSALPLIHTALGNMDEAIRLLEKAYDEGDYVTLRGARGWWFSPIYDPLLSDSRFRALLNKTGLSADVQSSAHSTAVFGSDAGKRKIENNSQSIAPLSISLGKDVSSKETSESFPKHSSTGLANVQLALESPKEVKRGESFALKLDLINTGNQIAFLHKIEGLNSRGLTLEDKQGKYHVGESGTLSFSGKKLISFAVETLNFEGRILGSHDHVDFNPRVFYSNEEGNLIARELSTPHRFVVVSDIFNFQSERTRKFFDYLCHAFIEDYMVQKLDSDKAGWRSLADLARGNRFPMRSVYGKANGQFSVDIQELVKRGVVETRFFSGERGRGGEVMRLRIDYSKEPIKNYIDRRVRGDK